MGWEDYQDVNIREFFTEMGEEVCIMTVFERAGKRVRFHVLREGE